MSTDKVVVSDTVRVTVKFKDIDAETFVVIYFFVINICLADFLYKTS